MGDDLIRGYLSELDAALAAAPGPARARTAIVAEIGDGLADAVADHLDHGDPPHQAARRAIDDFGTATALAAQFVPVLAAAHVHRCALVMMRTGPLVGTLWLITLLLAESRGVPLLWPAVIVAGITAVAAVTAVIPCTLFALTVTGRGSRRWSVPTRRAADAAQIATGAAILADVVLLLALSAQAAAGLTVPTETAVLAGLAALASLIRIIFTARGTRRLRRTRAILATG